MPKKLFEKGKSGNPKGRPVGTGAAVQAARIMEELGFEPVAEMVKLIRSTHSDKVKQEGIAWLGDKKYPSLKAVELSGDKEAPVLLNFNLSATQNKS